MTEPAAPDAPSISVIVPVAERYDDLASLHEEFAGALRAAGKTAEFLFVVDGGQKSALPALRELKQRHPRDVKIIVLGKSFGEAAALAVGIEKAAGETILTLASYFQVTTHGLAEALRVVEEGRADVVIGRRFPRSDAFLNRVQARVFHALVGWLTSTRFNDISCGFRLMKREVASQLDIYGDLHRFIPILAANRGYTVREIPMRQRAENRTARYPGVGVYLRRLLDLLTVFFLIKFTRKPLRFFGLIGSASAGVGVAITLYLGIYRLLRLGGIADRPLLLLGVLLMVLGVQSISIGLLGEIIIFTHARRVNEYRIAEIL